MRQHNTQQSLSSALLDRVIRAEQVSTNSSTFEAWQPDTGQNEASTNFSHKLLKSAKVYVQVFRWLPVQIMVQNDFGQLSRPLPDQFQKSMMEAAEALEVDCRDELSWVLYGYRHGTLEEAADLVIHEIVSSLDEEELERWVDRTINESDEDVPRKAEASPIAKVMARLHSRVERRSDSTAFWSFRTQTKRAVSLTSTVLSDDSTVLPRWNTFGAERVEPRELPKDESCRPSAVAFAIRPAIAGDGASAFGTSSAIKPALDAMCEHTPTAQKKARQYFSERCHARTDRFIPVWKKRRSKKK